MQVICLGLPSQWMWQTGQKGRSVAIYSWVCVERGMTEWWCVCVYVCDYSAGSPPHQVGPLKGHTGREEWIKNQKVYSLFPILSQGSCVALGKSVQLSESLFPHL